MKVSVPETGLYVHAVIYDIGGRVVRVLHDGELPEGDRDLVWDGRNSSGIRMPVGLYFLKVQTEQEKATIKLVLAR
jgi:flagellar hook assembly protein FlgD